MFLKKPFFCLFIIFALLGCAKEAMDPNRPITAEDKRKKNIEEGRGVSLGGILKGATGTNFEFSTSNPMWRASLETLDFLPLNTVDYSGGIIITDWYSDTGNKDSIKLTVRFLSNEITSESLKIIVHKKTCKNDLSCKTVISNNSLIENELRSTILRKAALLQKSDKDKKKK
tara:strand:- start:87 stop:602 length:516 start_codon:yes stop_codon:yes gene_type:complete